MRPARWWLVCTLASVTAAIARGQPPAAIQLPTYSHFRTSTTVSVPDQGAAWLGKVNRAESSSKGTPLVGRAMGAARSAAGVIATVTVHDFEAMEQSLLEGQVGDPVWPAAKADSWGPRFKMAQHSSAGRPAPSVAEIESAQVASERFANQEASECYAKGRQAEAEGRLGVAKIYYGMAIRRTTGPARQRILARLAELAGLKENKSSPPVNGLVKP